MLQQIGMSDEVTTKIQAKADSLTAERKRRGKTVPEGLATSDDISQYRQMASHTVGNSAVTARLQHGNWLPAAVNV